MIKGCWLNDIMMWLKIWFDFTLNYFIKKIHLIQMLKQRFILIYLTWSCTCQLDILTLSKKIDILNIDWKESINKLIEIWYLCDVF